MNRRGTGAVQNVRKGLVRLVDPHGEAVRKAKGEVDDAYRAYTDASVRKGTGDTSGYADTVEALRQAHRDHEEAVLRQVGYDAKLRAGGLVGLSGLAVPGVSGMIGYQGAKAGGQDGNV